MSIKRLIVAAGLDSSVRSIVDERPPSDHFGISKFDENISVASAAAVERVIFRAPRGFVADTDALHHVSVRHRREGSAAALRRTECLLSFLATPTR